MAEQVSDALFTRFGLIRIGDVFTTELIRFQVTALERLTATGEVRTAVMGTPVAVLTRDGWTAPHGLAVEEELHLDSGATWERVNEPAALAG